MVTTKLANLWTAMGYKVVLFTDEPADDGDYPLPAGLERVVLPDFRETTRENYLARAKALASAVEAHRMETNASYCQWISPILPWDMLLLKSLGVRFLVHTHGTFLSIYAEDHYLGNRAVRRLPVRRRHHHAQPHRPGILVAPSTQTHGWCKTR